MFASGMFESDPTISTHTFDEVFRAMFANALLASLVNHSGYSSQSSLHQTNLSSSSTDLLRPS